MSEQENDTESDSHTDTGDQEESNSQRHRTHPEELEMRAFDLYIRVQSETESLDSMAELASEEMTKMMRHSLRGDLEAIEEEEISLFSLGDD